jgi:hypothetical protein
MGNLFNLTKCRGSRLGQCLLAACAGILMPNSAMAHEPDVIRPNHISGSASATAGHPALSFDFSLDPSGRFERIEIVLGDQHLDLMKIPGSEKIRELQNVQLFGVNLGFEPAGPGFMLGDQPFPLILHFEYRPLRVQDDLCDGREFFYLRAMIANGIIESVDTTCY